MSLGIDSRLCPMKTPARAFTLVEMMVSMSILSLLVICLVQIVNSAGSAWSTSRTKVEQYRAAREAFQSITRRLSYATLNTYWDYEYTGSGTQQNPSKYVRKSELRFLCDETAVLATRAQMPPAKRPGHCVFFQAPAGITSDDYRGLDTSLNTFGFYVEFGSDKPFQPPFISSAGLPERHRYRLFQSTLVSEQLNVYATPTSLNWVSVPMATPTVDRPGGAKAILAENVICLLLHPKTAPEEDPTGTALAPSYAYDSTKSRPAPFDSFHQLPPLIQVTMIALDETSAARIDSGEAAPPLIPPGLFSTTEDRSAQHFVEDLATLENALSNPATGPRLNYRVFTTNVSVRAAKWSRE